jgi:hypothetical protein
MTDRTYQTAYERLTAVAWIRVESRLAGKSREPSDA